MSDGALRELFSRWGSGGKPLHSMCPYALFMSLCRIEAVMVAENFFALFLLPLVSAEGAFWSIM